MTILHADAAPDTALSRTDVVASPADRALSPADTAVSKEERLSDWLRARGSVLIGFSGGVDSAYLASVAVRILGAERTLAVIGRSASYPADQLEAAHRVAAACGLPLLEITTDEMEDPDYAANPVNRCYFCKTELWRKLAPIAAARGLATVVDGTNADDLTGYRPGARAARERDVLSPLAMLGFTKDEVRERSVALGIPGWDRPASPCLSSRIPYGTPVTTGRLRQIEAAERALRAIGVTGDMRVRHHDSLARVELPAPELSRWLAPAEARRIHAAVRGAGYERVAIDLAGFRSGSLNVLSGTTAA